MVGSMKKRKRSFSGASKALPKDSLGTLAVRQPHNPFLRLIHHCPADDISDTVPSKQCSQQDDVLSMVVTFLELTRKKPVKRSNITGGDDEEFLLEETKVDRIARCLLDVMIKGMESDLTNSITSRQLISTNDVTSLLLPWAIKRLLRFSQDSSREPTLEWEILAKGTELLLTFKNNSNALKLSSHFSLSVLQKLVPLAGSLTLKTSGIQTCCSPLAVTCYCSWVEHVYRPPFDSVAETLIPLIGEKARYRQHSTTQQTDNASLPSADDIVYQEMTLVTLALLRDSLKKANPKKAFQFLVRSTTMSALSDIYFAPAMDIDPIQSRIRSLLDDGLYHLDHHMDGFRSLQMTLPDIEKDGQSQVTDNMEVEHEPNTDGMSPKKSFHCYQETLFTMVQDSFSMRSIVQIVPLLLQGFIQQTSAIQQQKSKAKETSARNKTAAKRLTQIQFLFFANIIAPILRSADNLNPTEDEGTVSVLFQALDQCVGLLLTHDVYLPANEDDDGKNFSFLQNLSQHLIRYVRACPCSMSVKVLPILTTTFQLNHLIFHDQLSKVISSCLCLGQTDRDDAKGVPKDAIEFFSTIISTYHRLRQLDHFCAALLTAATEFRDQNDVHSVLKLERVTQDPDVVNHFCEAVQTCPIHQSKQMISDYNGWITSDVVASSKNDKGSAQDATISLVVGIFCLLLKSIRIDATTALDLNPLCKVIDSGSIRSMIGNTTSLKSVDHLSRKGLLLCGWTIDFKNRCDFWLRDHEEEITNDFDFPEAVAAILAEAMDEILDDSNGEYNGALEELQVLACHRLQQLHSRVQARRRIAFATDAEEFSCEMDIKDTKQVATFALKALQKGKQQGDNFNRRCDVLAEAIGSWAAYIEDADMKWFLSCFFARVTLAENVSLSTDEKDSAFWLLRDASFLETANVLRNFGPAGIAFVASTFQKMLLKSDGIDGDVAANPAMATWSHSRSSDINILLEQRLNIPSRPYSIHCPDLPLSKALRCLEMLNNVQGRIWDFTEQRMVSYFESCLRLEYVCRDIVRYEGCSQEIAFKLVVSLRRMLSRLLKEGRTSFSRFTFSPNVLSFLFVSTIDMMNVSQIPDSKKMALLDCTRIVVLDLISCTQSADILSAYSKVIGTMYKDNGLSGNETERLVLISFGPSIVSGLAMIVGCSDDRESQNSVDAICKRIWDLSMSLILDTAESEKVMKRSTLNFVSDMLRNDLARGKFCAGVKSIETALVEKCVQVINAHTSQDELLSTSYLIACLATMKPSRESRRLLFDTLIQAEADLPPIVQNALCELATATDSEELQHCILKLTSFNQSSKNIPRRLRLLRLIVLNSKSEEQIKALSKHARPLFSMALEGMTSPSSKAHDIQYAVELIEEMARSKEIISIRERDLCLVCAHVVGALGSAKEGETTVSNEIFNSCFSVVSFMLQRFSKQLHFCIPSVIHCLSVMLDHCICVGLQDLDVIDRGHKFSRLCELLLPHGEVYKKHVLCLVVAFVETLKNSMDPIRRNSLSPAIYCLLDVLQQHEKSQLNSMLDDMGRALLRTVHENYKKQHVYKGQ